MENDPKPKTLKSSLPDLFTDTELADKVNANLHAHCQLHSEGISVQVQDRCVYLEGYVAVEEDRDLARRCVEGIFGIRSVYNYLTFPSRLRRIKLSF